ncbi:hypothetical protein [uncultured Deinococcus sp.]|uniref:hypothetical protein n=1 Tax=uncultured Deinococcus sp. TaxID=158789 RepID=UPI00374A6C63
MTRLSPDFLRRRNALWAELRATPPEQPEFEATLGQLMALVGWSRAQVLAGLGLGEAEVPAPHSES